MWSIIKLKGDIHKSDSKYQGASRTKFFFWIKLSLILFSKKFTFWPKFWPPFRTHGKQDSILKINIYGFSKNTKVPQQLRLQSRNQSKFKLEPKFEPLCWQKRTQQSKSTYKDLLHQRTSELSQTKNKPNWISQN